MAGLWFTFPLTSPHQSSPEQESDERKCNYERYRGLVQNDFAGSEWRGGAWGMGA